VSVRDRLGGEPVSKEVRVEALDHQRPEFTQANAPEATGDAVCRHPVRTHRRRTQRWRPGVEPLAQVVTESIDCRRRAGISVELTDELLGGVLRVTFGPVPLALRLVALARDRVVA
jgi:hypothetical protein